MPDTMVSFTHLTFHPGSDEKVNQWRTNTLQEAQEVIPTKMSKVVAVLPDALPAEAVIPEMPTVTSAITIEQMNSDNRKRRNRQVEDRRDGRAETIRKEGKNEEIKGKRTKEEGIRGEMQEVISRNEKKTGDGELGRESEGRRSEEEGSRMKEEGRPRRGGANEVTEILPGLFLSGFRAVRAPKLSEMGISLVVNATVELPCLPIDGVEGVAVRVPDDGKSDLFSQLDDAVDRMQSVLCSGGRVLVHCVAGASRSPAVVMAYLVKHSDMSLRNAFQHVRRLRPSARPNSGFVSQLIDFELRLRGRTTVTIIRDEESGLSIPDVCEDELKAIRDKRWAKCVADRRSFQRVYA